MSSQLEWCPSSCSCCRASPTDTESSAAARAEADEPPEITFHGVTVVPASGRAKPLGEKASPAWYGKLPGQCCYTNRFAYEFTLSVDTDRCVVSNRYAVGFPNENPNAKALPNLTSNTVVHEPELVPGGNNRYQCLIEFGDIPVTAWTEGLPTTSQYSEEVKREEEYHVKQFLGQVSTDEGGQGDCCTAKGVAWMANCIGDGPFYEYGDTPEEATQNASDMVGQAEIDERAMSREIVESNLGFRELKAKAHAGFNAAYKYHCTYEPRFGPTPTHYRHPAYE